WHPFPTYFQCTVANHRPTGESGSIYWRKGQLQRGDVWQLAGVLSMAKGRRKFDRWRESFRCELAHADHYKHYFGRPRDLFRNCQQRPKIASQCQCRPASDIFSTLLYHSTDPSDTDCWNNGDLLRGSAGGPSD